MEHRRVYVCACVYRAVVHVCGARMCKMGCLCARVRVCTATGACAYASSRPSDQSAGRRRRRRVSRQSRPSHAVSRRRPTPAVVRRRPLRGIVVWRHRASRGAPTCTSIRWLFCAHTLHLCTPTVSLQLLLSVIYIGHPLVDRLGCGERRRDDCFCSVSTHARHSQWCDRKCRRPFTASGVANRQVTGEHGSCDVTFRTIMRPPHAIEM